jgi:hypothetical protein
MAQSANILDLMRQLLSSMDITDYEPAVPHMLVELFYRHVTDVLKEAQRSCEYRKSKEISEEDLKFAIQEILHQSLLHLPSLESMQSLARKINSQPLPPIPDIPEVIFPSEEVSLLEPNYQMGIGSRS